MTTQVYKGTEIELFRLYSVRGQIKLEQIGMRSSGGALRPRLATEFKLKPRDSYVKFIQAIDEEIASVRMCLNQ